MTDQIQGTVKRWCEEFGFVTGDDGIDYFLHYNECRRSGIRLPKEGDRLSFTTEHGPKGRLRAMAVSYV
jgi:CspA family cold shock protein